MIGIKCDFRFKVTEDDLVTTVFPDFQKPHVLASVRLLQYCEYMIMNQIVGCSLGNEFHIKHVHPTVLGAMVSIDAECAAVSSCGSRTVWNILVQDQWEILAFLVIEFVVVDMYCYIERRVTPKLMQLGLEGVREHVCHSMRSHQQV